MKLRQICIAFSAGILLTGTYIVSGDSSCPECDAATKSSDVPCKFSDASSTGPKCRYEIWSPGRNTCSCLNDHTWTGYDECVSGTANGYDIVNECPNTCGQDPKGQCKCQNPTTYSSKLVLGYPSDDVEDISCGA